MTALECIAKAAHCEAMAWAWADSLNACTLRETARQWRTLGAAAKAENPLMPIHRGDKLLAPETTED